MAQRGKYERVGTKQKKNGSVSATEDNKDKMSDS